jgi:hypothetical protein
LADHATDSGLAIAGTPRSTLTGSVGIGVAVGVYGISFGVLAVASGLSPAQACVMSMLVFTGASQFAFVGVVAGGGGALPASMVTGHPAAAILGGGTVSLLGEHDSTPGFMSHTARSPKGADGGRFSCAHRRWQPPD